MGVGKRRPMTRPHLQKNVTQNNYTYQLVTIPSSSIKNPRSIGIDRLTTISGHDFARESLNKISEAMKVIEIKQK